MNGSVLRYALLFASSLALALLASGEQVVTGPPPEIRGHIDALVKALNSGSSDQWEKMAQEHFSPGELKRHSVEERKRIFDDLRRDFGTISVGMVEGPDEPLRAFLLRREVSKILSEVIHRTYKALVATKGPCWLPKSTVLCP